MTVPSGSFPDESIAPNRLREERLAAGISTADDLAALAEIEPRIYRAIEEGRMLPRREEFERIQAALGGVPSDRLYLTNYRQLMGLEEGGHAPQLKDFKRIFEDKRGAEQLLIGKDEVTWLDGRPLPDRKVDAFLSMSCGTQESPHLLLDTVAVCEALDISFVAAAGAAGCCGKPYLAAGHVESAETWIWSKAERARRVGARVQVNFCTACEATATTSAARRKVVEGIDHPVRETQILAFLANRIEALGDDAPWKTRVSRRVLSEGHNWSPVHARAWEANARLLSLIPGVEVIGPYDGFADESPCGWRAREKSQGPWTGPTTAEEIMQRRHELADMVASLGADTIACQHQGCHQIWSRYASDGLIVQHAVSVVAEALGCAHPDRYQAAVRVGDPQEIVRQTRSNWESWGLGEEKALVLATSELSDPRYAAGVTKCSCSGEGGGCSEKLISLDVLKGSVRPT
jgi:transcriptional regulator with XRE-family HTH domain